MLGILLEALCCVKGHDGQHIACIGLPVEQHVAQRGQFIGEPFVFDNQCSMLHIMAYCLHSLLGMYR